MHLQPTHVTESTPTHSLHLIIQPTHVTGVYTYTQSTPHFSTNSHLIIQPAHVTGVYIYTVYTSLFNQLMEQKSVLTHSL